MYSSPIRNLLPYRSFLFIRYTLLLWCFIVYSFGCTQTEPSENLTFTLTGQIENSAIDTFRVYQDHPVDRIKVPVDEYGQFHMKIPLRYPRFVTLDLPVDKKIYVEPGDHIKILVRNGGLTTAYPVFQSDRIYENNLIVGIDYLEDSLQSDALGNNSTDYFHFLQSLPYSTFDSLTSKVQNEITAYVDTYAPSFDNPSFIHFLKKRIQWDITYYKLGYWQNYKAIPPEKTGSDSMPEVKIKECLEHLDPADEDLLGYDRFRPLLYRVMTVQTYDSFQQWRNDPNALLNLYNAALKLKNSKIRDKASFLVLTELIKEGSTVQQIARFDSIRPDKHYLDLIDKWSAFYQSRSAGQKLPDFFFQQPNGDTFHLNQLQGKLMYIDFWATWCKPCLKEYPYYQKLKQEYKDKNIEFVSISLDGKDKVDHWRNFIENHEMIGIQLMAENGMASDISRWLKIKEIPVFTLIGANGRLLEGFTPRPSSSDIRARIDRYLKN